MIMTKHLFAALTMCLFLAIFTSCEDVSTEVPIEERVCVEFSKVLTTKSVSDSQVNTLDLLVFRHAGGQLDCYRRVEASSVSAEVTKGVQLDYYLVANAPSSADLSSVKDRVSFLSSTILFTDNDETSFVMVGFGTETFTETNITRTVNFTRALSRIEIESVTPSYFQTAYQDASVTLERVFLVNVNGSVPYSLSASNGNIWYEKTAWDAEGTPAGLLPFLTQTYGDSIAGGTAVSSRKTLYCCPNPTDNKVTSWTEPLWSERNTRAVLQVDVAGETNYYPITLPSMRSGYSYLIKNVILTGPGSVHPDKPVRDGDRQSVSFDITVSPWGEEAKDINLE